MSNKEQFEAFQKDPKNYKGFFYYCPQDPRVIVPKITMKNMGWTINFAHPKAWSTLLLSFVVAVGPGLISISFLMPLAEAKKIDIKIAILVQAVVMFLTIIFLIISCRNYCARFEKSSEKT